MKRLFALIVATIVLAQRPPVPHADPASEQSSRSSRRPARSTPSSPGSRPAMPTKILWPPSRYTRKRGAGCSNSQRISSRPKISIMRSAFSTRASSAHSSYRKVSRPGLNRGAGLTDSILRWTVRCSHTASQFPNPTMAGDQCGCMSGCMAVPRDSPKQAFSIRFPIRVRRSRLSLTPVKSNSTCTAAGTARGITSPRVELGLDHRGSRVPWRLRHAALGRFRGAEGQRDGGSARRCHCRTMRRIMAGARREVGSRQPEDGVTGQEVNPRMRRCYAESRYVRDCWLHRTAEGRSYRIGRSAASGISRL
jgi:hypothetical protein